MLEAGSWIQKKILDTGYWIKDNSSKNLGSFHSPFDVGRSMFDVQAFQSWILDTGCWILDKIRLFEKPQGGRWHRFPLSPAHFLTCTLSHFPTSHLLSSFVPSVASVRDDFFSSRPPATLPRALRVH
jgi:hypothetical protein